MNNFTGELEYVYISESATDRSSAYSLIIKHTDNCRNWLFHVGINIYFKCWLIKDNKIIC